MKKWIWRASGSVFVFLAVFIGGMLWYLDRGYFDTFPPLVYPKVDPDPWELGVLRPDHQTCTLINRVFVLPVPEPRRSDAIVMLRHASFVALDENGADQLLSPLDSARDPDFSAPRLVSAAIASLKNQRHLANTRRSKDDHWSVWDQNRLDDLLVLSNDPKIANLRPFLVRAIAKNEFTGGFYVSMCDNVLWVSHQSLGRFIPSSVRLPLVVFLERAPMNVYVDYSMAE